MLIWDFQTWLIHDREVLNLYPILHIVPGLYTYWCLTLDLPSRGKHELTLPHPYFLSLEGIYMKTWTYKDNHFGTDSSSINTEIMKIEAHLNIADEQYGYQNFDYWLYEGWRRSALTPLYCFLDLFSYSLCHIFLSILSPSQGYLDATIVAATHLLTFFSHIEYPVDRLETSLVSVLLILPKSDLQEPCDPLHLAVHADIVSSTFKTWAHTMV